MLRMVTARFSNMLDRSIEFVIEPWGNSFDIPPGARFAVHYPAPIERDDTSHTEFHLELIRFWCQGNEISVEVNGAVVLTQ